MATIKLNGRDVNASALNRFSDFQGGPLGNSTAGGSARLTVDVSPTSFSYVVIAPNGGFVTSGTGIGLVFDALNRPIGGTITSLIEQSTIKLTGGPIAKKIL